MSVNGWYDLLPVAKENRVKQCRIEWAILANTITLFWISDINLLQYILFNPQNRSSQAITFHVVHTGTSPIAAQPRSHLLLPSSFHPPPFPSKEVQWQWIMCRSTLPMPVIRHLTDWRRLSLTCTFSLVLLLSTTNHEMRSHRSQHRHLQCPSVMSAPNALFLHRRWIN